MQLEDGELVKKVEERLDAASVTDASLSVDLVDHICCMIEERLDLGYSSEKAEEEVFREMGAIQLKSIEIETKRLTQNKFIMKKRTKIVGIISVVIIGIGLTFKLLHLPGAGITWGVGILLASLGFFTMITIDRFSYQKTTSLRLVTIIGFLGAAVMLIGLGFALLKWPIARYLATSGAVLMLLYFVLNNVTFRDSNETGG